MANLIPHAKGTPIVWTDTGGTYAMDMGGLTAGSVRAGTYGDLGAGDVALLYRWRLVVDGFTAAPTIGDKVHVYLSYSDDATIFDGDVSGTDGASSTVVLPNVEYLRTATVQTTTAGDEVVISGLVEIGAQYVVPIVYNDTGNIFANSGDAHSFTLTPLTPEIQ